MRIYAYVTNQSCRMRDAVNPGDWVGDRRAYQHGDYISWVLGKRETLAIIAMSHPYYIRASAGLAEYMRGTALAVAKLKGWR